MCAMTADRKIKYNADIAVKGRLEAFCEQGMTHSIWTVYDENFEQPDGQRSHDGLQKLERGDLLTVFNDESKKDIKWQGVIDFDRTTRGGAGLQKDVDEGEWIKMFMREHPAELIRAEFMTAVEDANQRVDQRQSLLRKYLRQNKPSQT